MEVNVKKLLIPAILLSCIFVGSEAQARQRRGKRVVRQCSACMAKRRAAGAARMTCANGMCSLIAARNVTK